MSLQAGTAQKEKEMGREEESKQVQKVRAKYLSLKDPATIYIFKIKIISEHALPSVPGSQHSAFGICG